MNDVIDFPTIEVDEPPAEALAPAAAKMLPAVQSLRDHSLAELNAVEQGLAKLRAEHGSTDYDITTPHGYRLATARRHAIRLVRYEVPKVVTAKRVELNEIRDAVKAEGERIIAALKEIEDPHDKLITAEDERKAAEKAERARIEAERKAKHESGIATIRSYADRCAGLSSERIAAGIAQLEAIPILEAWEEFQAQAQSAKESTLAIMCLKRDQAKEREDEAARLEAQRIENERIAAEQEAERRRLAEAAAKVKAEAEALQRRINEQAEKEAAAERERVAALAKAERAAKLAQIKANIAAKPIPEAPEPRQVLKAEPTTADATDRGLPATASPVGGPTGVEQPAAAGLTLAEARPVTFAEPEPADELSTSTACVVADMVDELAALRDMVRWAYGELHLTPFADIADALMLDRMKLYLEHGLIG